MGAATTRINPHDVLEPKIFSQGKINHLDGHCDELPTFIADFGFGTARADLVVIRQINIKAKLFPDGLKLARIPQCLFVAGICSIYGTNFESSGNKTDDVFFQSL